MAVTSGGARPRGIRVRTSHTSEAAFIAAFQDLCDDTTVFAPTEKMKPVGAQCAFSLELADGTPMLRGLGLIRNAWPMVDSPFGQPGIHIEIDQLTTSSEPIFDKLLAARAAAKPRTRPAPSTHQLWGPPAAPVTEEMETATVADEEPEVAELPQKITKELVSAKPPEDLTEHITEEKSAAIVASPPPPPVRVSSPAIVLPPRPSRPPPMSAQASAIEPGYDTAAAIAAVNPRPWWMQRRIAAVFAAGLVLGLITSLVVRPSSSRAPAVASNVQAPAPAAALPAPPPSVAAIGDCVKTSPPRLGPPEVVASAEPTASVADPVPQVVATAEPAAVKPVRRAPRVTPPTPAPGGVAKAPPKKVETSAPKKVETSAPKKVETSAPKKVETSASKKVETSAPKTRPRPKRKNVCSSLDCI